MWVNVEASTAWMDAPTAASDRRSGTARANSRRECGEDGSDFVTDMRAVDIRCDELRNGHGEGRCEAQGVDLSLCCLRFCGEKPGPDVTAQDH